MISNARRALILPLLGLLMLPFGTASGHAYDEAEAEKMAEEIKKYRFETITTKEGLKFSIPSDMPIERKDGMVTPIPFDEYLYFKFKKIEEKQIEIDKKVDKLLDLAKDLDKKTDKLISFQEAQKAETAQ